MLLGSCVFRLAAVVLVVAPAIAAQQEPAPKELPNAPIPKQTPTKHQNPFWATVEILGQRSAFFPDLAASRGPLTSLQKFELFADKSVAPSRDVTSALGATLGQARNSLPGYGQGWSGYGKRFGSSMATGASTEFFGTF